MTLSIPAVGAVIVNYKARDHLLECVRSLRAEGVEEIVVVDNDSGDGSQEALAALDPSVSFLATGSNLGYGTAANLGASITRAGHLLISNPDIVLGPGSIKAMVAVLDAHPSVAIVGPRLENRDGTLYPSPRTFPDLGVAVGHAFLGQVAPGNRFTRRYRMLDWDHSATLDADWVSGACFLIRRDAWERLGGFDQSYFMYVEDVDLCWRAKRAGWCVAFEPAARLVHAHGVSSDQRAYRMILEHHRSLFRFYSRTTTGPRAALLPLVGAGLAVRAGLVCAHRAFTSARAK